MATRKTCRVCGAEYTACNSAKTGSPVFNWREVACSPECGLKYLKAVTDARSASAREPQDAPERESAADKPVVSTSIASEDTGRKYDLRNKRGLRRYVETADEASVYSVETDDTENTTSAE